MKAIPPKAIPPLAAAALALIGLLAGATRAADVFTLVTPGDVTAEREFEAKPGNTSDATTRSLSPPANPTTPPFIKVIAPSIADQAIASPVRIELTFETSADARVLPESFRVLYGFLKVDITEKLRPYAKVTEHGLVAENAAIPTGNHRLFVQVSDSAGRTSVREVRFTVDK